MADILVRVPGTELDHFWEELPGAVLEWWTLGRRPTRFGVGDVVFFALGKHVVAYAVNARLERGQLHSDDGRDWQGEHVVWGAGDFRAIPEPVPLADLGLRVPRGFAYCGHTDLRKRVGL